MDFESTIVELGLEGLKLVDRFLYTPNVMPRHKVLAVSVKHRRVWPIIFAATVKPASPASPYSNKKMDESAKRRRSLSRDNEYHHDRASRAWIGRNEGSTELDAMYVRVSQRICIPYNEMLSAIPFLLRV